MSPRAGPAEPTTRVFVYGTLLAREPNNRLVEGAGVVANTLLAAQAESGVEVAVFVGSATKHGGGGARAR